MLESAVTGMEVLFKEIYDASVEVAVLESCAPLMQKLASAGVRFEKMLAVANVNPGARSDDQGDTGAAGAAGWRSESETAGWRSSTGGYEGGGGGYEENERERYPDSVVVAGSSGSGGGGAGMTTNNDTIMSNSLETESPSQHVRSDSGTPPFSSGGSGSAMNKQQLLDTTVLSSIVDPTSGFLRGFPQDLIQAASSDPWQPQIRVPRNDTKPLTDACGSSASPDLTSSAEGSGSNQLLLSKHFESQLNVSPPPFSAFEMQIPDHSASAAYSSQNLAGSSSSTSLNFDASFFQSAQSLATDIELSESTNTNTNTSTNTSSGINNSNITNSSTNTGSVPFNRRELQSQVQALLIAYPKSVHALHASQSSLSERIVRHCLLTLLQYYAEHRYKDLQRAFHFRFFEAEQTTVTQLMDAIQSSEGYAALDWIGLEEAGDIMFTGYAGPKKIEKWYIRACENGNVVINQDKFLKLVCGSALNLGFLPRVSYTDLESATLLATANY